MTKKRKAQTPAKKVAPKKSKATPKSKLGEEITDTAGDEELALKLAGEGRRESVGKKAQRAKALADIRKVRASTATPVEGRVLLLIFF